MLILIGDRILLTNLDFQLRNAKITRFWNRVKKIIRTIHIKLDKNPYLDKDYWLEYKNREGNRKLTGMYKKVWEKQKGICPFCNSMIDINADAEERPLHHKDGNHKNHTVYNLIYTHIHCHKQCHIINSKLNNCRPTYGF